VFPVERDGPLSLRSMSLTQLEQHQDSDYHCRVFADLSVAERRFAARAPSPATTLNAPVAPDGCLASHASACEFNENWREHDEGKTFHEKDV
jgi:hypothetical protein